MSNKHSNNLPEPDNRHGTKQLSEDEGVPTKEVSDHVQDDARTVQLDKDISQTHSAASDEISLYLPTREEPLVFKNESLITIGREDPTNDIELMVDLTPYYGGMLGVSRQHARIRRMNKAYYLEDMDSANGTWVNDERLEPFKATYIKNGDQIRLAHLIMYVRI
jgi:hypothetical protein